MKILSLDQNHPLIVEQLSQYPCQVIENHTASYEEIVNLISSYDGIILRSRIPIDKGLLSKATSLKFIARVGAGMENIDVEFAQKKGIELINSPEGNRDAVAEHVLGMLLLLMNRLVISSNEVKNGIWKREENRGEELLGKTVGIIGYGNMGKATAKRLSGFGCKVVFYDILPNLEDDFAKQVSLEQLKSEADIISLHVPLSVETEHLINTDFLQETKKSIYLINTARGKNICTRDVVDAIKNGKIKGVALDVLEFEKPSFENIELHPDLDYLLNSDKAIITPHIAGWTVESKEKLAQVIVDKIVNLYLK